MKTMSNLTPGVELDDTQRRRLKYLQPGLRAKPALGGCFAEGVDA